MSTTAARTSKFMNNRGRIMIVEPPRIGWFIFHVSTMCSGVVSLRILCTRVILNIESSYDSFLSKAKDNWWNKVSLFIKLEINSISEIVNRIRSRIIRYKCDLKILFRCRLETRDHTRSIYDKYDRLINAILFVYPFYLLRKKRLCSIVFRMTLYRYMTL